MARSVSPANNGATGEALVVGDIVVCTFGEGPNNSGKFRDIKFEINSVGQDKDLIDAAGGFGAFKSLANRVTGTLKKLKKGFSEIAGAYADALGGGKCIDMATSKYNKESASTISVAGNTCDPATLSWTGRVKSGGKIIVKTDVKESIMVSLSQNYFKIFLLQEENIKQIQKQDKEPIRCKKLVNLKF